MMIRPNPVYTEPQTFVDDQNAEDAMMNDSLGTIDIADSTGNDEELETGDARAANFDTRED